jgi:hypothetical protein
MRRLVGLVVVAGLASGSFGCATAHYVSKQPDGGVVAIPANTNMWPFKYRDEADALIRRHVGPDFEIVGEQQVVTGTRVTNSEQTQKDLVYNKKRPDQPAGEVDTKTGTTTASNTTEWQITYRRRYNPAAAAGPGVVPSVLPSGGTVPAQPAAGVVPPVGPGQ